MARRVAPNATHVIACFTWAILRCWFGESHGATACHAGTTAGGTNIAVGEQVEAFERRPMTQTSSSIGRAAGICCAKSFGCARACAGFTRAGRPGWAAVPELVESAAALTNATACSANRWRVALAGILFFAKDLGRMIRNQAAGKWSSSTSSKLPARRWHYRLRHIGTGWRRARERWGCGWSR